MIGGQSKMGGLASWGLVGLLILVAYVAWPYVEVYRLDRAVIANDEVALSKSVDLDSVRNEIKKRLNKEMDSQVGDVSNEFVDWIQDGLLRLGSHAIDSLVSLEWVREQLLAKSEPGQGFRPHVGYAFFDSPTDFLVRIGDAEADPVYIHLRLQGVRWKVSAVYN